MREPVEHRRRPEGCDVVPQRQHGGARGQGGHGPREAHLLFATCLGQVARPVDDKQHRSGEQQHDHRPAYPSRVSRARRHGDGGSGKECDDDGPERERRRQRDGRDGQRRGDPRQVAGEPSAGRRIADAGIYREPRNPRYDEEHEGLLPRDR